MLFKIYVIKRLLLCSNVLLYNKKIVLCSTSQPSELKSTKITANMCLDQARVLVIAHKLEAKRPKRTGNPE